MNYKHDGLAYNIASKFKGRCNSYQDFEDLMQETRLLIHTYEDSFDKTRGVSFTSYCHFIIYRKLLTYVLSTKYTNQVKNGTNVEFDDIHESPNKVDSDFKDCIKYLENTIGEKKTRMIELRATGYYNKEIGNLYGTTAENIRLHLKKSKKHIDNYKEM